ncbi:MAG: hypothetical protein ACTSYO_09455 [Candidatus Ranarchaeia archaeon]
MSDQNEMKLRWSDISYQGLFVTALVPHFVIASLLIIASPEISNLIIFGLILLIITITSILHIDILMKIKRQEIPWLAKKFKQYASLIRAQPLRIHNFLLGVIFTIMGIAFMPLLVVIGLYNSNYALILPFAIIFLIGLWYIDSGPSSRSVKTD